MDLLSRIANAFFDFLFPKSEKILALEELSPEDMVKTLPGALDTDDSDTLAIFSYEHPVVREMIWELKYRGNRVVAEKLGIILSDVLKQELADKLLFDSFGDFASKDIDVREDKRILLMPMPISDKRRNERGYNQTELLTEEVKKQDSSGTYKYVKGQLVKHRHTNPQTLSATKRERLENLASSMHIIHPPAVKGREVVLIDDVTTTGATFREAKRALQDAGAKRVLCIAIAH
jgi:ComF family protein